MSQPPDYDLEAWKNENAANLELWKHKNDLAIKGSEIVVESGFQALKTLILVSAGSSAALLAFLSGTWDKIPDRSGIANALAFFSAPLFGGSLVYGLTYLTHLFFWENEWRTAGHVVRIASIIIILLSYVSLAFGFCATYAALDK